MTNFTRKTNRLPFKELYQKGYWYFVTICVQDRKCIFVEEPLRFHVKQKQNENNWNGKHSTTGKIVNKVWLSLTEIFENVILDEHVIMPNHFHAIIGFEGVPIRKSNNKEVNLSTIVSSFKSLSWHEVNNNFVEEPLRFQMEYEILTGEQWNQEQWNGKYSATKESFPSFWQKSFYDHVIRDEKDLLRIQVYIENNPLNWGIDSLNPINCKDE